MFHLLVRGGDWPQARASFDLDRVITVTECTDGALVEQFKLGGVLNTDRIAAVPALFVTEIGGSRSQQARIGDIIPIGQSRTSMDLIQTLLAEHVS